MRAIRLAQLDKTRPVLILTREVALGWLANVTVAPITSTIRGIATEVPVGADNGLDQDCVVSLDNVVTIPAAQLRSPIGLLFDHQEDALAEAIRAAFDLI
jgi:mRNA interferase MazF